MKEGLSFFKYMDFRVVTYNHELRMHANWNVSLTLTKLQLIYFEWPPALLQAQLAITRFDLLEEETNS